MSRSARPRRPRCDCSWCLSRRIRLVASLDVLAEAEDERADFGGDDDAGCDCYSCCPGCEWCADAVTLPPWLPTLAEVARVYDPERRAAEKQAVRDRDAEALRSGESVADLRGANGLVQARGRIREFR